jgi:hypothetical protein
MASDDRISFLVLEAQKRIFRLAERNHGLKLKTISLDSGIPYNSIRGYAAGETVLPVPAMLKLVDVVPDELLSQLLEPVQRCLMPTDNGGDHDLDALGEDADAVATEVRRARRPDSPGGTNIHPIERSAIIAKASKFTGRAKGMAA